jgi:hypothetical protein
MGRVKVPRCDNCGAPVEFGQGVLEARCEYCGEVLIREFPVQALEPAPPPFAQQHHVPPVPAARHQKSRVWPLLIGSGATVAIAAASGLASFSPNLELFASSVSAGRPVTAVVREVSTAGTQAFSPTTAETRRQTPPAPKVTDAGTSRPRSVKPRTPVAPAPPPTPSAPPKPPRFDTQAAVAGLDAAKAKAESSCKSTTVKSLFVQMGFSADGKNRGAALSDPKHNGTPEAKCVLRIFRAVSIPAFDPATRPSGLGRGVRF